MLSKRSCHTVLALDGFDRVPNGTVSQKGKRQRMIIGRALRIQIG